MSNECLLCCMCLIDLLLFSLSRGHPHAKQQSNQNKALKYPAGVYKEKIIVHFNACL